jgi:hypothetical protein
MSSKPTTKTPIPRVAGQGKDVRAIAENLEVLLGARGDAMDRALILRDLQGLGVLKNIGAIRAGRTLAANNANFPAGAGTGTTADVVIEAPTAPEQVAVAGSLSYAFVTWKQPEFSGYANTEVFRSATDDFGSAVSIGTTNAGIYPDKITFSDERFYWVRHINADDDQGPIQSTAGVSFVPSERPDTLLALLENKITLNEIDDANVFDVSTFAIRSEGDTSLTFAVHDGKVLMDAGYIHNLTVTNAQIDNLAATKLTGFDAAFVNAKMGDGWIGNAQIGQVIQSDNYSAGPLHNGWKIDKVGVGEFNTLIARGVSIYNDAGQLILGSGSGVQFSALVGAGALAALDSVNYDDVSGTKPPSNADVTDYADFRIANGRTESGVTTILSPAGGKYQANTSGKTGAIVITLPQSWTNTMMKFEVEVFNYNANKSFTAQVGGYNYAPSTGWYNAFAQIIGNTTANNRVRMGHNGTKCVLVIGDVGSVWDYPQISVRNFFAGYSNYALDNWDDGWSVDIVTSLAGYTFNQDFSDTLLDAKSIVNQGAFATLNQITTSNYSTYIQSAVIDNLLAGRVNIIDTLMLRGQAVTIPSHVYTSGSTTIYRTSNWVQIQSLTYTSSGEKVSIDIGAVFRLAFTLSSDNSLNIRLKRNGSVVRTWSTVARNPVGFERSIFGSFVLNYLDTYSAAGSRTYTVEADVDNSSNDTAILSSKSITALEVKR